MFYKTIVIAGPTGVGKTALSIKLAKLLNAEIISADSMQIYKGMDIGTAKISKDEMQGIKHHMIDIVDPDYDYSVGEFEKEVNKLLNQTNTNYLLVGGTGLYIGAVTDGMAKLPDKDDDLREKLENTSLEELLLNLEQLDKVTYDTIDKNNKVRVVRALEVCLLTNDKFSNIVSNNVKGNNREFLKVFLTRNRDELYDIINRRIDKMLEDGLLEEARFIHEKYPNSKAIGYKELFSYFDGKISLEEAIELLKKNSRHYAKRQLTWFNAKKEYMVFNLSEITEEEIIKEILTRSEEK